MEAQPDGRADQKNVDPGREHCSLDLIRHGEWFVWNATCERKDSFSLDVGLCRNAIVTKLSAWSGPWGYFRTYFDLISSVARAHPQHPRDPWKPREYA